MTVQGTTRVQAYCRCGAKWEASGNSDFALGVVALVWEEHRGEGHGPTDATTARRARAKSERQREPAW